jgi:di/tricarboxylate transporter
MSLAWISLIALGIVIVLSCTNRAHPGFLALALAFVIGVFVAPYYGVQLKLRDDILAGFPVDLFLTLTGVSLLFTQAHQNGTLDRIAQAAVGLCRGNVGLIPWMFFALSAAFATAGAGNIAAAALLAPTAMTIAAKARIPAVLMTILVGHGAIAGALSPISPTGIIADAQMNRIDLGGNGLTMFWHNALVNVVVAAIAFVLFGGVQLFWRRDVADGTTPSETTLPDGNSKWAFAPRHWITLALIATLMAAVIFFQVDVGMGAFVCAIFLALAGLADDVAAVKAMPWSVILMVCGVNVLTALLERDDIGGTRLFAQLIVAISSATTAPAIFGFVAAIVSVYSSTSGVVLPAFLPMVSDVAAGLPGSDPLALALAVIVAGHLVDSSPLSTIGALCIAGAGSTEDRRALFTKVLLWGLAMSLVGAGWCLVIYGLAW